jgi:K+-sensing histidine kinase KdpD
MTLCYRARAVNLLENAHKYSPPPRWKSAPTAVRCCQYSTAAPGWSGRKERIFENSIAGSRRNTAGGTGLGLSICRGIIERMAPFARPRRAAAVTSLYPSAKKR